MSSGERASVTDHTRAGARRERSVATDYHAVREFTTSLCAPLETEDYVVQSMPDASPTRWHLAHMTWFFETFCLKMFAPAYRPANPAFESLFNSYYNTVGTPFPRRLRGLLTRPTVAEVFAYRQYVDEAMTELLARNADPELQHRVRIGLDHEQQHQELLLTDLKHAFAHNPLRPAYRPGTLDEGERVPLRWASFAEALREIGAPDDVHCYDNEQPRHRVFVEGYELATRLTTNAEYLEFIRDGGYSRHELWLSEGWDTVVQQGWTAPLYWEQRDGTWHEFTLRGLVPLAPRAPVTHVSFFEADAFARWAGCRLPTEAEWELAAEALPVAGNFVEQQCWHPCAAPRIPDDTSPKQLFGDAWEWTRSSYGPYPGYKAPPGALGEYNGKFMCNQYVLRGGSCATPRAHMRSTYRNFFAPHCRWQFTSIRLAR